MATIRKRAWTSPTGEQREAWQVDFVDQDGARRHKQFRLKKEADAYLTKARSAVAAGTFMAESDSPTIGEAIDAWIARGEAKKRERSTILQRRQHKAHILAVLAADTRLARISVTRLEAARDELLARHSVATARKIVVSLRAVLRQAKAVHLASADLAIDSGGRHRKRLEVGVDIPMPTEVKAMVESATGEALALVCLAAFAGLRASEIRGLRWTDTDLGPHPSVTVTQRADRWQAIGSPKSAAARRTIPLPDTTVQALRSWKLAQPAGRSLVFGTRSDRPDDLSNLRRRFLAPISGYGFHALRHYAISAWLRTCNGDFKLVQIWAGHSSLVMTVDRYGHLLTRDQHTADAEQGLFG